MTEELHDPNKPAGWVWKVREEDGVAIRNDGDELQSAAWNPWYVLMTVHGEQEGDGIDRKLAAKNRRIWNGWACSKMSGSERAALAAKLGLPVKELKPWSAEERTRVEQAFEERLAISATGLFQGEARGGATRKPPAGAKAVADIPDPGATIDLSEIHFCNTVVLQKCIFPGSTCFGSAAFGESANFQSASFGGLANFGSAAFGGDAFFGSASFGGNADFQSASFGALAYFDSASFGDAIFRSASFSGIADFSNGTFEAQTDFTGAQFAGAVPKFYQRKFHQDTDFTTRDRYWPAITEENAADSKRAFTRLRQIMNDLHKPDDEHFFGRQEMRCKAVLEGPFYRAVSWAYAAVSDYGHSIARPLTGLALAVAAGWFVLMVLSCPWPSSGVACGAESGREVLALSFSNTFAFLGFHRLYFGAEFLRELAPWMKFVGATQSIAGFVLLFFLGLGLRNRFRLK